MRSRSVRSRSSTTSERKCSWRISRLPSAQPRPTASRSGARRSFRKARGSMRFQASRSERLQARAVVVAHPLEHARRDLARLGGLVARCEEGVERGLVHGDHLGGAASARERLGHAAQPGDVLGPVAAVAAGAALRLGSAVAPLPGAQSRLADAAGLGQVADAQAVVERGCGGRRVPGPVRFIFFMLRMYDGKRSEPVGAARVARRPGGAGAHWGGRTTRSITWITPLPASTSAAITLTPFTRHAVLALGDGQRGARQGLDLGAALGDVAGQDAAGHDVVGEDRLERGGVLQQAVDRAGGQRREGGVVGREDRERPLAFSVSTRPAAFTAATSVVNDLAATAVSTRSLRGRTTRSITWITPLEAWMSACTTLAPSTRRPLSVLRDAQVAARTVLAHASLAASAASTRPGTTWYVSTWVSAALSASRPLQRRRRAPSRRPRPWARRP